LASTTMKNAAKCDT